MTNDFDRKHQSKLKKFIKSHEGFKNKLVQDINLHITKEHLWLEWTSERKLDKPDTSTFVLNEKTNEMEPMTHELHYSQFGFDFENFKDFLNQNYKITTITSILNDLEIELKGSKYEHL